MTRPKGQAPMTHLAVRQDRWARGACSHGGAKGKPRLTDNLDEVTCGVCKITPEYLYAMEASRDQ